MEGAIPPTAKAVGLLALILMKPSRHNLRIQIVSSTRTDLMCVYCGGFKSEFGIVCEGDSDDNALVGVHKKCAKTGKVQRKRRTQEEM